MAANAKARRPPRAADASLPRPHRARPRDPARLHRGRARAALPREARDRRGDQRREPRAAHLDRRPLPGLGGGRALPFLREHVPDRLDGRASARRPPEQALPPPRAALDGLLRAQSRRRHRQPDHERRRGARPARHRRRHEPRPEHAPPPRHRGRPLPARLAARAGDAHRAAADGACHGVVPASLEPRLPQRPRAARARDRDPGGGHLRDARRPVVHARTDPGARASTASTAAIGTRTTRRPS